MKLPQSWTTVTLLSKILAILLFVSLPFIGFHLGKKYQQSITIPATCSLPTAIPTGDTRILLTTNNAYEIQQSIINANGTARDMCDVGFNSEPANTFVTYRNIEKGIEISIPYNNNWGNEKYRIDPYDKEKTGISFGSFREGEGCSWKREYGLSFVISKNKEQTKKNIISNNSEVENSLKEYFLNNMVVFKWTQEGLGCGTVAEFVGSKSNLVYYFDGTCEEGLDLEKLKYLASITKQI